jgi:hypothetical protein
LAQRFDLVGVLVDADHLMAEIGEADARDEADISGADDGNFHEVYFRSSPGSG